MRWWLWILLVLVVLIVAVSGYFFYLTRNLQAEAVAEDVWVLFGLGGNVTVIRTGEGAVLVDSMTFRATGKRIRRMAEQLTGEPVRMVINTHYHLDHTHGNPAFAQDTRIVSPKGPWSICNIWMLTIFPEGPACPTTPSRGSTTGWKSATSPCCYFTLAVDIRMATWWFCLKMRA